MNVMALKYATRLKQCPDQPCPCMRSHERRDTLAFRLMHNPAGEEQDFEPPGVMDEAKRGFNRRAKCGRFALSFFDSVESARRTYKVLAEREDAESRYGSHIGEIDLAKTDGLMSLPSAKSGHVNLHQEAGALFAHRVIRYYSALDTDPECGDVDDAS